MLTRTIRNTTLAIVTAAAAALLPQTARADHDSYEYAGRCYQFHAEQHMIDALRYLEQAYVEHARGHVCGAWLQRAQSELSFAYREADCPIARRYLIWALDHVRRFSYAHHVCDLDDAARLVRKGLDAEREMFLAHRHDDHGPGYGGIGHPVGPVGPGYVPYRRGGISIRFGNGRGGIRFSF